MPEVLEIEQIKIELEKKHEDKIASWLADIPSNVIEALDLKEGSKIALTVKNGEISGDILPPPSPEMEVVSRRILEKRREMYEELKRLGD